MIPLSVPNLTGKESEYLLDCIKSTFVSSVGQYVTELENRVSECTNSTSTVATSSGTSALHLGLVTLGVKPGDLVVLPDYTFIASANAISHASADPWLVDIDSDSWTLSPSSLRHALRTETVVRNGQVTHRETGRPVTAIMPVYAFGHPAEMKEIAEIAQDYGIAILADGAAALGAKLHGEDIGAYADATAISFNGNKTFTCGGGGALVSNNDSLIELARHLSTTARVGKDYHHDAKGFNYRMTNIQAAVGCAQLERYQEFVTRKRNIARRYREAFIDLPLETFPETSWAQSANWLSGVVIHQSSRDVRRTFIDLLRSLGVDARAFWIPMSHQSPYASCPTSDLSVSSALFDEIVVLPSSTGITDAELDDVVQSAIQAARILQ